MTGSIQFFINVGIPLATVLFAYVIGTLLERRHYRDIQRREQALRSFPVITSEQLPGSWVATEPTLLVGSVVVSLDYFKRIIAGLRGLVGGRIKTYEPLLDRARREALLRLLEQARQQRYDAVINVRLETSRMANSSGDTGTAGIEMIAFGTAIRLQ